MANGWTAKLTGGPTRHCQWFYFLENPQGGGFGSNTNAGASMASAWRRCVERAVPYGTPYRLTVNGKDRGEYRRSEEPWVGVLYDGPVSGADAPEQPERPQDDYGQDEADGAACRAIATALRSVRP
jgi:hypothetical protein